MVAALDERPLSNNPNANWVSKAGGLPGRIRGIARRIMQKRPGMSESEAIALAIHLVKTTAATGRVFGGKYAAHADTKAVHSKAAGQWEALKARAHAHSLAGEPALELAMLRAEMRALVVELATPISSTQDGARLTTLRAYARTPAGRRALLRAHLRRRQGATK